ncbi:adenylate/guanylate cyclase domain-containing protein [Acinetobacter qingfengensis]|uniref:Guanylate cyclase n=1 Tax=Acinetobacter qingfengensis TaxID=1262585 RepID=A0A1E7R9A0_9GAMM|nr:adenylate/guanylate cyclase domain-containing protein [Acinetobacter qingfengensis]KAA8735447.1 adenylate/guanylate cyclase domain-containing protein [Acinetobacter qingfengensis]OEY95908.1 guanylate cyclase [Acinetobacter qingfengensis]
MKKKFLDVAPYQFIKLLRLLSYLLLSLIMLVSSVTEINIEFFHLVVIPVALLVLLIERFSFSKIEYHYGKDIRNNITFLSDVFLTALFISAMHMALIPSMTIIGALIYSAIFRQIHYIYILLTPIIGISVFYISSFLLFGFEPYIKNSSLELNVLSLISFLTFIAITMYYQTLRISQLHEKKLYYFNEMNRYVHLNNQLARYAPTQVWQSIMRGEIEAKIEYKRRKLTVFFSDIQGFTELSDQLIPDDLAFLLNDYLTHMTDIAKHYGGTIDKFMGDGILIFFGDPDSRGIKEDAIACLNMAVAMRQQMRVLRERWIKLGFASLHIRMGIATGYCHVGNYGTSHRMAYSIVGRDANIAARLQSAADVDQILISDETFNLVREHFLCIKHPPLKLKGISGFIQSWQVIEHYHDSIDKYRRWYDYEYKGFNLLLNLDKTPIYQYPELIDIMEKTIERLKLQRDQTDFDGVVPLKQEDIVMIDSDLQLKQQLQDKEKTKP